MSVSPPPSARLKVFLVEDNEDTRLMLAQLLRADGFDVCTAGSMHDALTGFDAFSAAVLLSDLGLPDGDGWKLLRALRGTGRSPYAIAMSGFGTLADIAASLDAGYRHHMVKPIEIDVLERFLDEAQQEIGSVG